MNLLALLILVSLAVSSHAEQVLGAYIFSRHGDRTAKSWKPVNLTALGTNQLYSSGDFYRRRYINWNADFRIKGISPSTVVTSQLDVTAPIDTVLQNSALVFLQGLYPSNSVSEQLANGSWVIPPLNGYQYIPISPVNNAATGKDAENSASLQAVSGCNDAIKSSKSYETSIEYQKTYLETKEFYRSLLPVINGTFSKDQANFDNAYTIFDLINVAIIHNTSIPSRELLNPSTMDQLYNLASIHEWGSAYSQIEPVRAMAGSLLAGQVVNALGNIVSGKGSSPRLSIQFGAYGTFNSFFGLAQLPAVSDKFRSITDYASTMAFEIVTNVTDNPTADDMSVRFLYANGSAANNGLNVFPLFGQNETLLKWKSFKDKINGFAVTETKDWCSMCGNTEGICLSANLTDSLTKPSVASVKQGMSKVIAGVIGSMVTLAVTTIAQALIMFFTGFRFSKKNLRRPSVDTAKSITSETTNVDVKSIAYEGLKSASGFKALP